MEYEIRYPGSYDSGTRSDADIHEKYLFVRPWTSPFQDPTSILGLGGVETQFFNDRRTKAMRTIRKLKNSVDGITSITSANIEFVPHQIACVKRILTDPT